MRWKVIHLSVFLLLLGLWFLLGSRSALADEREHIVRPGDNLFRLALAHGTTVEALARANGLADPSQIRSGQRLIIPTAEAAAETGSVFHVVRTGETVFSIARKYGVSPWALARANQLADANRLLAGQRLVVPVAGVKPSAGGAGPAAGAPAQSGEVGSGHPNETGKWIDVHLSTQTLIAYEGQTPVYRALISSGLPATPTVTGRFRIWIKLLKTDMSGGSKERGDYYYLKDVPYVQYFYEDYALHGTYWHNNFGQPMSRGCVNLSIEDAKWLFEWTSPKLPEGHGVVFPSADEPGTVVVIHE